MARYFFHAEDGHRYPDKEGVELPDIAAVRGEAIRVMADLLHEHARDFWKTGEWKVVVTDDTAMTLFTLVVAVQLAPAAPGSLMRET